MTVTTLITDMLRRIPAWLRTTLLATFAAAVVVVNVLRIFEVDLAYDKIDQTLNYLGLYLGIQSIANVNHKE